VIDDGMENLEQCGTARIGGAAESDDHLASRAADPRGRAMTGTDHWGLLVAVMAVGGTDRAGHNSGGAGHGPSGASLLHAAYTPTTNIPGPQ
jgi:hypothetical protein